MNALVVNYRNILYYICPNAKSWVVDGLVDALPKCIEIADLTTDLRLAHFLSQISEESDYLTTTVEYATGGEYEGRADLGNTQSGDGRRFRGMGLIQITGRKNFGQIGQAIGVDLIAHPELLQRFPAAALSAAIYWRDRAINAAADRDNCPAVTLLINGGYNGLAIRQSLLDRAKRAIARERSAGQSAPVPSPDLGSTYGLLSALEKLGLGNPVKAFQQAHGLTADGDAGPATQAAILKALAGASS